MWDQENMLNEGGFTIQIYLMFVEYWRSYMGTGFWKSDDEGPYNSSALE